VAEAANGGQVLISDAARERLEPDAFALKRLRRFKAKGAPGDLAVFAVSAPA
jgi:adenylate cyclase